MNTSTYNFSADPMELDCRSNCWFHGDMPLSHNINATSFPRPTMAASHYNSFETSFMTAKLNPLLGQKMTPLYQHYSAARAKLLPGPDWGSNGFRSASALQGSTKEKFVPVTDNETIVRNGATQTINMRYQNITLMPSYRDTSVEEIRFEDYLIGNVEPFEVSPFNVADNQFMKPHACMNPTIASSSRNDNAYDPLCGGPSILLQTLLQSIKNRFNLNSISDEAKMNCEILAQKLADFTEKTFDKLTIVVLEDMLNNIKKRHMACTSFPKVQPNNVNDAGPSWKNFVNEARAKPGKKHAHLEKQDKKNRKPGINSDLGSESENCSDYEGEDVIDCNRDMTAEQDGHGETKRGRHRKLSNHLLTDNKDTRRRIRSSHQTTFKQDRYTAGRVKAFIKKRDMKCTCADGEDTVDNDCSSRSNEMSRAAWKKERSKKSSPRNFVVHWTKKTAPEANDTVTEECCLCELLRTVSVNDENRPECSLKKKTGCRKEHHSSDCENKDNEEGHAKPSNHSVEEKIVTNVLSDGSTLAADDIHSSSDSSSV